MRIFYDNKEITKAVQRLDAEINVFSYVAGKYIYIASDFPFNHTFIKMGSVKNTELATMKVEYYATAWSEVAELRDETNALSTSGFIEFTPNRNYGWSREQDSANVGVSTVVYDKYWTRISFDVSLDAGLSLSFIGNKFSDDEDLFSEYPVFNDANYMSAFKTGKTDWEEQHIKAAEIIISDLERKGVIISKEQILDKKKFTGAAVCKTAEIIFTSFGNDYIEQKKAAKEEYTKRIDLKQYNTDTNNNAILEPGEIKVKQGWLSR